MLGHQEPDYITRVCVLRPLEVIIVSQMRSFPVHGILLVIGLTVTPAAAQKPAAPAPETAAYYFLLARHYEATKKVDEAIDALKKAIELSPDSAELRAELAGVYARQDRARDALDAAEAALKQDPANREANRILGSIYAALSDQRQPFRPGDDPSQYKNKAVAALEKARREVGVDLSLELMLGRLYLQAANYDNAIVSLRRVVDGQPGYPEAAMLLAAAFEGAGQNDDAIRTLELTLDENPDFFRGHVRLAELYERQHRFKDAADAYAHAQAANSRADLGGRQAASLINAGQPSEARDLLQAAIARKTAPDAGLLYMLAQSQRLLKDTAGASATAQKLRAAFPSDARALYLDAQILDDQGKTAESITAFQALIKQSPDDASLVLEYANLLEKDGRPADAERALRDLLAKDPLDANALNSLGYLLAERGDRLDEAVELVQRALKVEPGNPSYLDSLGWAYYKQGKLELADSPLTEAAEKVPANSVIQDHLGDLRFKQQRFADAEAAWRRSLGGDGDSVDRPTIEKKIQDARTRVRR
jgi:tetratricopeptide (TPR) repeat protein